jgi:hypothetical protein
LGNITNSGGGWCWPPTQCMAVFLALNNTHLRSCFLWDPLEVHLQQCEFEQGQWQVSRGKIRSSSHVRSWFKKIQVLALVRNSKVRRK